MTLRRSPADRILFSSRAPPLTGHRLHQKRKRKEERRCRFQIGDVLRPPPLVVPPAPGPENRGIIEKKKKKKRRRIKKREIDRGSSLCLRRGRRAGAEDLEGI